MKKIADKHCRLKLTGLNGNTGRDGNTNFAKHAMSMLIAQQVSEDRK